MLLYKISGSYHVTLPSRNLEQQKFYLVIVNDSKLVFKRMPSMLFIPSFVKKRSNCFNSKKEYAFRPYSGQK